MDKKRGLFKNKNILYELTRKRVKTQYRNSVLGMVWTVLNPLLNMLVLWFVFSQFFGRNDPLYPIYLLSGTIMFQLLRSSTDGALTSIVGNRGLLTKINIDTHLFPLSSVLSAFINFSFSLISLILIMAGMQIWGGYQLFGYQMLFVLLMLPAMFLFSYGIALFLSALYVYFRDIKYLYSVGLTLWTYLTPIFWKINIIDEGSLPFRIVKLNPMYHFVKYFRECMYDYCYLGLGVPEFRTLLILYGCGIASIIIGYLFYKPLKRNFMTHI